MRGSGNVGENEDYFGCIDRSTGTKVHASFMLFCAGTIFRTVGARVGNRRLSVIEL